MGLYVNAYQKVSFHRALTPKEQRDYPDNEDEFEGYEYLQHAPAFRARTDGLADGLYATSGEKLTVDLCGYRSYGQWREQLAELVGTSFDNVARRRGKTPGPFVELIWFSDCEGFIGPRTSAKLAHDFAEWQERADLKGVLIDSDGRREPMPHDFWRPTYADLRKAFELAAGAGLVNFF